MSFTVEFRDAADPQTPAKWSWPVTAAVFVREFGHPVRWTFILCEYKTPRKYLADLLEAGRVRAVPLWIGQDLSPDADVVAVRKQGEAWAVDAVATRLPADAGAPRRRAHRPQTLHQLLATLGGVAALSPAAATAAQQVGLAPHPCVIQDGDSDWEFLARCLAECELRHPNRVSLALSGGAVPEGAEANANTANRWLVVLTHLSAYRSLNHERDHPAPKAAPRERPDEVEFGHAGPRRVFPHDPVTASERFEQRWRDWLAPDLPWFWDARPVPRVEDRFTLARNQLGDYDWVTAADFTPLTATAPVGHRPAARPWVGTGKVSGEVKSPWFDVTLDGFEAGYDTLTVRLSTPFSGTAGGGGWHLPPRPNTRVVVTWSGRFTDPAVCLGNIREGWPGDGPSLTLDQLLQVQLAGATAKSTADLTVHGDTAVKVESGGDLTLSNRKAKAVLTGDEFQVGRGG